MMYVWYVWGIISVLSITIALILELLAIKNKVNGANGFVYFMIHIYYGLGTTFFAIITFVFTDLKTMGLFLFISMSFIITEVFVSMKLMDYFIKKYK